MGTIIITGNKGNGGGTPTPTKNRRGSGGD